MQMMYETIYKALQEVGMENEYEPQDYLNFFCLGNRETDVSGGKPNTKSSSGTTPQVHIHSLNSYMSLLIHFALDS